MSNTKQVQMVREIMLSIYGEGCWMAYRLTKKNPYTYHHIHEARNGGKVTIDNGAILTRFAHDDLNELEKCAPYLYRELNSMFKELNGTRKPPTKEYFKEVNGILLRADKIITLSDHCELNPDYVMLEEFAQITQENYPDIPDYDEFARRISERQVGEKVKSKKHNAKRNSRHDYSRRKYY